jgi:hypothetical protein
MFDLLFIQKLLITYVNYLVGPLFRIHCAACCMFDLFIHKLLTYVSYHIVKKKTYVSYHHPQRPVRRAVVQARAKVLFSPYGKHTIGQSVPEISVIILPMICRLYLYIHSKIMDFPNLNQIMSIPVNFFR